MANFPQAQPKLSLSLAQLSPDLKKFKTVSTECFKKRKYRPVLKPPVKPLEEMNQAIAAWSY